MNTLSSSVKGKGTLQNFGVVLPFSQAQLDTSPSKTNPFFRRLNSKGYQRLTRKRHLTANVLKLSDGAYRLWDLMVALYDWDEENHPETFGTLKATDRELAEVLRHDPSTVWRNRKELLDKKVIQKLSTGLYRIFPFPEFTPIQDSTAQTQDEILSIKQKIAPVQEKQAQSDENPLVSFKDDSSLLRSKEEYDKMWEEFGSDPNFTQEDMAFIDKLLYKETGVRP